MSAVVPGPWKAVLLPKGTNLVAAAALDATDLCQWALKACAAGDSETAIRACVHALAEVADRGSEACRESALCLSQALAAGSWDTASADVSWEGAERLVAAWREFGERSYPGVVYDAMARPEQDQATVWLMVWCGIGAGLPVKEAGRLAAAFLSI